MPQKSSPNSKSRFQNQLPRILIFAGVLIVALAIILIKNQSEKEIIPVNESPEQQLDRLLEEGKPVFVFFHSTDCVSCTMMMDTVDQIYPTYQNKVALVDVHVYDPENQNLLQRAAIRSIPTQLFVDSTGYGIVAVGVMTTDQLDEQLALLAGVAR